MKKFFTKQLIYSLIAAAVFLTAACTNPVTQAAETDVSTAPGTGQVRISFTDGAARTIYPATVFDHYVYTFTRSGGTPEVKKPNGGVFTLETGSWTLAVEAYATSSSSSLAATGSTAAFTINEGQLTDNITVTLTPVVSEGQGDLSYTITYPAGATLGTLSFVPLGGGEATDLLSSASTGSGTITGTKTALNAGYYLISAALTKAGKTAGKSEVVHIYKNMTTDAALTFTSKDFTKDIPAAFTGTDPGLYIETAATPETGTDTLALALAWLQTNAADNTNYTILIGADESLPPWTLGGSPTGSTTAADGKTGIGITLKGKDSIREIQLSEPGSLFTVDSGVTLSLDHNISLKGISNNNVSLVWVNSGGTLELKDGAKISGNTANYSLGGGVYVEGTFTMEGGEISGNTADASYSGPSARSFSPGGGVYVGSGTFTMEGGEISGNTAAAYSSGSSAYSYSYGGGVYVYEGTFTMEGGEISGNTASSSSRSSAYSYSYGGGVYVYEGTFTMEGGEISGNTASSSSSSSYGSSSYGGGVYAGGTFTMEGGEISGNIASSSYSSYGGGVLVSSGTFTMEGGEISGNTASSYSSAVGGGVYISSGTFTMKGGTVYGNAGGAKANKLEESGTKLGVSLYKNYDTTAEYGDGLPIIAGIQTSTLYTDDTLTGHN
ncbi:hypothetical protein AGMMS4952_11790 [Spirochaetia bacterium]|nr:hypothetical protein AGMMS4952_11790 [Spirochaetia bacterium]